MAKSHFSYEKRRKELEKQKKKEAKREAKAARKAAIEAGEIPAEPVVMVDEFGNVVEVLPEDDDADAEDGTGSDAEDDADRT
ncbi:MAG: hypothetical protein IH621_08170 [Krumholzibacteria bacterium]|nr:hypothetical protein [Candidatus Krumholzibacteria bacterium]